jgi:hypothetical protein
VSAKAPPVEHTAPASATAGPLPSSPKPIACPNANAAPAATTSAPSATTRTITGRFANNPSVQDPSEVCAMSMLDGHRAELLSLHICWAVTGALGGDFIDHGRFTLDTRDGTLSGT